MTPDPLGGDMTNPQSLNRYAYALNNPATLTDPSGLQTCGHPGMTVPFGENPATWCYNHMGIGGGSSPGAFFTNTADEFDVIFPTGCDEGGCGPVLNSPSAQAWWFLQSALSVLNGGVFDTPANLLPPGPAATNNTASVSCSGPARVLQGNAATIGKPGGFSGKSAGIIPVTANGAAVIPNQWGGKAALRPFLNQIGGIFPNVNYAFQGVVDVVGSKKILNVQAFLMSKNPGDLILELPGAPKDFGVTPLTLTIPGALPCPAGTSQVQQ